MAVEAECPVGRFFGVLSGVGEGVVWKPVDPRYNEGRFWFKVKGEKHSVTMIKQRKEIAPIAVQRMSDIREFAERCVTENRCKQGMHVLGSSANIGGLLRWVVGDVRKEEGDTIAAHDWQPAEVNKALNDVALRYLRR
jgi:hypothetical protein